MSSVTLAPEMYARVEQIALARQTTVDSVLTEALKRYLWEMQREVIAEETRAFRETHARLVPQYLGQYIAMRAGQVVDADADLNALRTRVRARFGLEPILMAKVEQAAETPIMKRGFVLEGAQE